MKYFFSLLLICFLLLLTWFSIHGHIKEPMITNTQVVFQEHDINLGITQLNSPVQATFKLTNTGNSPLIIQQVETSCGCTTPNWTKKPIKPDSSGEIIVTYDAKYPGRFHKTITVYANVDNVPIQLSISGEVEYDEGEKQNN